MSSTARPGHIFHKTEFDENEAENSPLENSTFLICN